MNIEKLHAFIVVYFFILVAIFQGWLPFPKQYIGWTIIPEMIAVFMLIAKREKKLGFEQSHKKALDIAAYMNIKPGVSLKQKTTWPKLKFYAKRPANVSHESLHDFQIQSSPEQHAIILKENGEPYLIVPNSGEREPPYPKEYVEIPKQFLKPGSKIKREERIKIELPKVEPVGKEK